MVRHAAIDIREFLRFALTGVVATVGNVVAVWMARQAMPFEAALLVGIAAGLTISFLMSKLFAFGSPSWDRAGGEFARFLIVYGASCGIYWVVAVVARWAAARSGATTDLADMGGLLTGAATMALTSYLGHRFFTYGTHRRSGAPRDVDLRPAEGRNDPAYGGRQADPCLVCGSPARRLLFAGTYAGSVESASGYFLANRTATAHGPIVRCEGCGFVFTSPRFSPSDYDRIYKAIEPAPVDAGSENAKAARFRRLAAIVRRYQPHEAPFLDFGCGDGSFLRLYGSPAGRGFEIGSGGTRMAGPCEIVTGDWADLAGSAVFPPASFEFIVAFDVLEHLPRIEEDVARIRTLLKPGGLFFASVPNIGSAVATAMGKRWNMLLLEHLWYFSPATFERFMARLGFEMIAVRAVPFDASMAHLATRLAQTFGMKGTFRSGPVSRIVLPVSAGIMLGVFKAR
jgi:putative flippase GtrA/SAM-dependent methyltransferase